MEHFFKCAPNNEHCLALQLNKDAISAAAGIERKSIDPGDAGNPDPFRLSHCMPDCQVKRIAQN